MLKHVGPANNGVISTLLIPVRLLIILREVVKVWRKLKVFRNLLGRRGRNLINNLGLGDLRSIRDWGDRGIRGWGNLCVLQICNLSLELRLFLRWSYPDEELVRGGVAMIAYLVAEVEPRTVEHNSSGLTAWDIIPVQFHNLVDEVEADFLDLGDASVFRLKRRRRRTTRRSLLLLLRTEILLTRTLLVALTSGGRPLRTLLWLLRALFAVHESKYD